MKAIVCHVKTAVCHVPVTFKKHQFSSTYLTSSEINSLQTISHQVFHKRICTQVISNSSSTKKSTKCCLSNSVRPHIFTHTAHNNKIPAFLTPQRTYPPLSCVGLSRASEKQHIHILFPLFFSLFF